MFHDRVNYDDKIKLNKATGLFVAEQIRRSVTNCGVFTQTKLSFVTFYE